MSAIIVAGNEIIPDTLTVTVDGTEITAKDFQKVLLNINQASATVSVADGTDLMQKMEIINKNANACNLTYKDNGGNVTIQLGTNKGARLLWVGGFWKCTVSNLITGTDMYGNPVEYLGEATIDTKIAPQQYTTTEQPTGETWIDGKPIYRRVFTATAKNWTAYTNDTQTIAAGAFVDKSLLYYTGTLVTTTNPSLHYPIPFDYVNPYEITAGVKIGNVSEHLSVWIDGSGNLMLECYLISSSIARYSGGQIRIITYYTKTTD